MKFLLCVLCSIGCDASEDREEYRDADKTAAGYHVVYHDAGLLASGILNLPGIYAAFDAALLRAALDLESAHGIPRAQTLALPHDERWIFKLVDHYRFTVGDIHATGQYDPPYIAVAMHVKGVVPPGTPAPPEALPWTFVIGPETGNLYFGRLDYAGAFPALAHEIGHHYFGPGFEH